MFCFFLFQNTLLKLVVKERMANIDRPLEFFLVFSCLFNDFFALRIFVSFLVLCELATVYIGVVNRGRVCGWGCCRKWQLTCDRWQMTSDIWHLTWDTWFFSYFFLSYFLSVFVGFGIGATIPPTHWEIQWFWPCSIITHQSFWLLYSKINVEQYTVISFSAPFKKNQFWFLLSN